MIRRILILLIFFLGKSYASWSQTINWPTVNYSSIPWIDSSSNSFQITNKTLLKPFFLKLQNSSKKSVNVLHIQDFHIQHSHIYPYNSYKFQKLFGFGGTGILFPYSIGRIAEIPEYKGYKSFHSGKWIYSKHIENSPILPSGLNFISAKTFDPLSQFKLYFQKDFIKPSCRKVHIFCKRNPQSFDIKLKTKTDSIKIDVYANAKDSFSTEIVVELKSVDNTLIFELIKRDNQQEFFEFYGMHLENIEDQGIDYHSVGSVSLGYSNLDKNKLIEKELLSIKPDLIVLELGKYDFFSTAYDPFLLKRKIIRTIEAFKNLPFKPMILLISPQDQFKGKYSDHDFSKFSLLLNEIAKSQKVALLDWYRVSGGHLSMNNWKSSGFATNLGNELTKEGEILKSSLLIDAFKQTQYRIFSKKDSLGSSFIPITDSSYLLRIDSTKKVDTSNQVIIPQNQKNTPEIQGQPKWITHSVKSGETVWTIAENYDVKAIDIKKWNNLRSYSLKKGKKLKIYTSIPNGKSSTEVDFTNTKGNPSNNTKNKKYHKVKRGDTLFSISRKHGIGVNEIKELNKMKSNDISIGQKIRVK